MAALVRVLAENVREGDLWEPLERNRIRCLACGYRCPIPEGQPTDCRVRFNRDGRLYVPWGYTAGVPELDDIAGAARSSCRRTASACYARADRAPGAGSRADAVVSTYNEPLITAEWAVAVFKEAHRAGLPTGFVSNGSATARVLQYVRP